MSYDCLICNLPYVDIDSSLAGRFSLNAVLKKNNYQSKVIDFNLELYKVYKTIWPDVDTWKDLTGNFYFNTILDNKKITDIVDQWVQEIIEYNPRYLAISVFSSSMFIIIFYFLRKLKEQSNIKTILGGPGIIRLLKLADPLNIDTTIVDHIVLGYGEEPLLKILNNTIETDSTSNLIYNWDIDPDFINVEPADYSDINISEYGNGGYIPTYISRSCLNKCTFCEIPYLYKRFREKPMQKVFDEITDIKEKYNGTGLFFCDSMINSNNSKLEELCNFLIPLKLQWLGNWRITNKTPDYLYNLVKMSGADILTIGIESGSDAVRQTMNKYISNENIFQELDKLNQFNLKVHIMFITGYISETEEEFQKTLSFIDDLRDKNYSNIYLLSCRPFFILTENMEDSKNNINYLQGPDRHKRLKEHIKQKDFNFSYRQNTEISKQFIGDSE